MGVQKGKLPERGGEGVPKKKLPDGVGGGEGGGNEEEITRTKGAEERRGGGMRALCWEREREYVWERATDCVLALATFNVGKKLVYRFNCFHFTLYRLQ